MRRVAIGLLLALGLAPAAPAAVVVLANYTPKELTVTVSEPGRKPQSVTLAPAQVAPVRVTGPATITVPARPEAATLRLDPYHAYVLLPDEKAGTRLEGIELPGDPPERDARPEANPAPPGPVKVPVTLLVDDADPRAEALWQKTLRKRFEAAAAVIEAHAGVRFEVAGFATWRSDRMAKDVPGLMADFADKVEVKPGALAIGFTSRTIEDRNKDQPVYGACGSFPTRHVLLREWEPRSEAEKVEVLVHHLGLALGATLTPAEWSVMRPNIADGLANHVDYRYRFDPLNALAMSLWADEIRRGPLGRAGDATAANRIRLRRVYKALLEARPGDTRSLGYINELEAALARDPEPKKERAAIDPKNPDPKPVEPTKASPRDAVARAVVQAVTARARANTGQGAVGGDKLAAAYVAAAAAAAVEFDDLPPDSPDRVAGFLVGLAVALDDTGMIRNDPFTGSVAQTVEPEADREVRLALLGNPTLRGRRDLCRRFAVGCGMGELLTVKRAEDVAVDRTLGAAGPAGVSFPALVAELAGVKFAQVLRDDPGRLGTLAEKFIPADHLPETAGLRDGLPAERFEADYGGPGDARFEKVLDDIRGRVKKLPGGGR